MAMSVAAPNMIRHPYGLATTARPMRNAPCALLLRALPLLERPTSGRLPSNGVATPGNDDATGSSPRDPSSIWPGHNGLPCARCPTRLSSGPASSTLALASPRAPLPHAPPCIARLPSDTQPPSGIPTPTRSGPESQGAVATTAPGSALCPTLFSQPLVATASLLAPGAGTPVCQTAARATVGCHGPTARRGATGAGTKPRLWPVTVVLVAFASLCLDAQRRCSTNTASALF